MWAHRCASCHALAHKSAFNKKHWDKGVRGRCMDCGAAAEESAVCSNCDAVMPKIAFSNTE